MLKKILIKGAKEHNLKNISLEIPKDKFVVITGLSGSGKSSLAFDTVYAEGQRRYVESLSAYARQFLDKMKKPNVDLIEGLSPAISIEQKNTSKNPRSTVATVTEIYDYMRVLYARAGIPYSPFTGKPITSQTISQIVDKIKELPKKSTIYLYAPVVRGRKGEYKKDSYKGRKRTQFKEYFSGYSEREIYCYNWSVRIRKIFISIRYNLCRRSKKICRKFVSVCKTVFRQNEKTKCRIN